MRFLQRAIVAAAAVIAVSSSAAVGHGIRPAFTPDRASYSGSWSVTVSNAERGNGTYCLTLKETQQNGGSASLTGNGTNQVYGGENFDSGDLAFGSNGSC